MVNLASNNPFLEEDLVSVIIPTYNRSTLVLKAIHSVKAQTLSSIQLIVVNDGSTDNTSEVLSDFPGIEVVNQKNSGQGAARLAGLSLARGRYLASLDSDDIWEPNFLELSIRAMRNTGSAFTFANWITAIDNEPSSKPAMMPAYLQGQSHSKYGDWLCLNSDATRQIFTRHNPAPTSSWLVDRVLIPHGWRTDLKISDDWEFLLRSVIQGKVCCAYTEKPLWVKRFDGLNICDRHADRSELSRREVHDIQIILESYSTHLSTEEIRYLRFKLATSWLDLASELARNCAHFELVLSAANKGFVTHPSLPNALRVIRTFIHRFRRKPTQ